MMKQEQVLKTPNMRWEVCKRIFFHTWLTLILLVLGAHFFRSSNYGLVLCTLGIMGFFYSGRTWHCFVVAFFLVWGAVEWAGSAYLLATMRQGAGFPWIRATLILAGVSFATLMTGLYMLGRAKKRAINSGLALTQSIVFMVVFCLLIGMGQSLPIPLLLLERYLPNIGTAQIFFMSWYAALVVGWLSNHHKSRVLRKRIWFLFSLVFFGQLGLGLLGFERMLMTGNLHVPIPAFIIWGPVFRGTFSMMPLMAFAAILLAGSGWCSLLCYFGGFDALAAGHKTVKPVPQAIQWFLRYGRLAVLLLGTGLAVVFRLLGVSLQTSLLWTMTFVLFSLLVMLFGSRKYNSMMHCTCFCPFGLLVNSMSRLSPWRIKVDSGLCNHCGVCEKICQYRAITEDSRRAGGVLWRCSLCRDCIGFCREKAIRLVCPGLSSTRATQVFVGVSAVLHTLFISIARV